MTELAISTTRTSTLNRPASVKSTPKPSLNKLLIVDDEPDTILLLKSILEREGYEVTGAFNGLDALAKMKTVQPALVISDMMMPQMDGWQTIQKLHEISDIPIIILSVLNQTDSIVRALELGADDYITKPFDQTEVIARVESVLRRSNNGAKLSRIGIESIGLVLDLDTREAFYQEKCFQLTGKMFDVLYILMQNSPRLVTYEELTTAVWGEDSISIRNRLKYLIYLLRQQFMESDANADFIQNIGRLGYKISTI
jgi:Response regulators consisting of a CheY-like receiver domain and a winged-helix DNA-binding domain